ncbi:hypothetical protein ANANG_G00154980 [Anguilla anguilla]|uniref:Uncharacterized protein n=1 Tax=Anguilla anguilla TaxID=7936 RepID=A0A9D3RUQ8_ANGAN|nr:hypothetical protein ANANG_G00154980 [Anguilla anguilla]
MQRPDGLKAFRRDGVLKWTDCQEHTAGFPKFPSSSLSEDRAEKSSWTHSSGAGPRRMEMCFYPSACWLPAAGRSGERDAALFTEPGSTCPPRPPSRLSGVSGSRTETETMVG